MEYGQLLDASLKKVVRLCISGNVFQTTPGLKLVHYTGSIVLSPEAHEGSIECEVCFEKGELQPPLDFFLQPVLLCEGVWGVRIPTNTYVCFLLVKEEGRWQLFLRWPDSGGGYAFKKARLCEASRQAIDEPAAA